MPLGWIYGLGVAAVAVLLVYEHVLVRPDDLTRVNVAFFNINAVISIGLFVVGNDRSACVNLRSVPRNCKEGCA